VGIYYSYHCTTFQRLFGTFQQHISYSLLELRLASTGTCQPGTPDMTPTTMTPGRMKRCLPSTRCILLYSLFPAQSERSRLDRRMDSIHPHRKNLQGISPSNFLPSNHLHTDTAQNFRDNIRFQSNLHQESSFAGTFRHTRVLSTQNTLPPTRKPGIHIHHYILCKSRGLHTCCSTHKSPNIRLQKNQRGKPRSDALWSDDCKRCNYSHPAFRVRIDMSQLRTVSSCSCRPCPFQSGRLRMCIVSIGMCGMPLNPYEKCLQDNDHSLNHQT
jgi:hypothetical protein